MTRKQKYARHYSNPHSREMKGSEGKTRTRFPYDSQGDDSSSEGGVSHKKTLSVENLSSLNRASPQEISYRLSQMPHKSLKRLVRQGVPKKSRPFVWPFVARIEQMKRGEQMGYYYSLLARKSWQNAEVQTSIRKDLTRTFPNHPLFRSKVGEQILQRILTAYAVRNPELGYCQSMNFLAGVFMLILQEEDVFWTLSRLIETILPIGYYCGDMLGVRIDMEVLKCLLAEKLPEVSQVLKTHHVDITACCSQWFLCLFVKTLPVETCLRVWDCLLFEGNKLLFRTALALFKLNQSRLLACEDTGMIYMCLQEMGKKLNDEELLVHVMFHGIGGLPKRKITKLRERCEREIGEEMASLAKARAERVARREAEKEKMKVADDDAHASAEQPNVGDA